MGSPPPGSSWQPRQVLCCLLRLGGGWAEKAPTATLCQLLGGYSHCLASPSAADTPTHTHPISPRNCCICKVPAKLENTKFSAPNYRNGVGNLVKQGFGDMAGLRHPQPPFASVLGRYRHWLASPSAVKPTHPISPGIAAGISGLFAKCQHLWKTQNQRSQPQKWGGEWENKGLVTGCKVPLCMCPVHSSEESSWQGYFCVFILFEWNKGKMQQEIGKGSREKEEGKSRAELCCWGLTAGRHPKESVPNFS